MAVPVVPVVLHVGLPVALLWLRRSRLVRVPRVARRAAAPEAPGAVPGFGHLPLIGLGALGIPGQRQPHQEMGELQETWSEKGVLRMRFGAADVFLLSSPEAVEEALCGENLQAEMGGEVAAGRPSLPSVRLNGLSQGLSSSQADQDWETMRSVLLSEAFASSNVARAAPLIQKEAEKLLCRLSQQLASPLELRSLLRRSFTRLLFRWALSLDDEDDDKVSKLEKLVEEAWNTLTDPVVTATDFLGSVSLPGVLDDLPRIRRERTRLLRSLIAARRSRRVGGEKVDFLDAMLEAQKKHGFGEDLIVETLVSLTTAGISTVSTALEWLLLLLAFDRNAQDKAREEGGEYLDACILEALRLKTPLFIPRRCFEAMEVAGYEVPAGSLLLPDSYRLAHDDQLWEQPQDFKPERFLGRERFLLKMKPGTKLRCPFSTPAGSESSGVDNSERSRSRSESEAAKFLPFGLGARFCPGAPLARQQLKIYATVLLEKLQWKAEGRSMDLSEAYSFTLTPANPPRLIFALKQREVVREKVEPKSS